MNGAFNIYASDYSLPVLEMTISKELETVCSDIDKLPQPISNPQKEFFDLFREFTRDLNQTADGDKDNARFVHATTNIFRDFRARLLKTIPTFDLQVTDRGSSQMIRLSTPEVLTTEDNTNVKQTSWSGTNLIS